MSEFIAIFEKELKSEKERLNSTIRLREIVFSARNLKEAQAVADNLIPTIASDELEEGEEPTCLVVSLPAYLRKLKTQGKETQASYKSAIHKRVGPGVYSTDFNKALSILSGGLPSSWESSDGPESGVGVDYYFVRKNGSEAYINVDQNHCTISVDGETIFAGELQELNAY